MNSAVLVAGQQQRAWTWALASLGAVLIALVLIFWSTAAGMVTIWWRSETFTHAFIVPPMVFWLAWRRRDLLLQMTPKPAYWVLLPMGVVAVAWLLGHLVAVNAVTQLALVTLMVLAVPAVLGIEIARALTFPLCFAFFAVPIGEFALPVLMQWTADFTVGALRLSGVPVFREGLRFVIPTGYWSVVEACSGVRYLIASFMVGSLYAYLNYQTPKRRWIFVGLSILVPILANWVRAYIIVMLGHLSNNKIATGVDHLIYGWIFFGIVIMALFTIGARWAEPEDANPAPPGDRSAVPGNLPRVATAASTIPVALLSLLVAAVPALGAMRFEPKSDGGPLPRLSLPDSPSAGWQAEGLGEPAYVPAFQNPTAKAGNTYVSVAKARVGVHAFYYQDQREESKVVSSSNAIVRADDHQWNAVTTAKRQLTAPLAGVGLTVLESDLLASDQSGVAARERVKVWMWYWIDGQWTSNELEAKLLGVWGRLNGRGNAGAAIVLYASERQPGGADPAMLAFMRDNHAFIESRLVAARDGKP